MRHTPRLCSMLHAALLAATLLLPTYLRAGEILVGWQCASQMYCYHLHMVGGDRQTENFALNRESFATDLDIGEGMSFVWPGATAEIQLIGPGMNFAWQVTGFDGMIFAVNQILPVGDYTILVTAETGNPAISLWIDSIGKSVGCCGSTSNGGIDFILSGNPVPEPSTWLMLGSALVALRWSGKPRWRA